MAAAAFIGKRTRELRRYIQEKAVEKVGKKKIKRQRRRKGILKRKGKKKHQPREKKKRRGVGTGVKAE